MDNHNDSGSGANTILIVIVLVILVGFGVWWFTTRGADNSKSLDVNVQLPGGGDGSDTAE